MSSKTYIVFCFCVCMCVFSLDIPLIQMTEGKEKGALDKS